MSRTLKRRVAQVEDALKMGAGARFYVVIWDDPPDVAEGKIQQSMERNRCCREQIVLVRVGWVDGAPGDELIRVRHN